MAAVKDFLKRKNVIISVDRYLVKAMGSMTLGLFASLLCGLILKVLGEQTGIEFLVTTGQLTMDLMGPAIGVAIAYGLEAPPLVVFASVATGAAGSALGGIAGAFIAVVLGVEFGKMVHKETKVDLMVTPMVTILIGFAAARLVGPYIDIAMTALGSFIMWATTRQPFIMGLLVSVSMGMVLTLPVTSSAAFSIMLKLTGLTAGAATVGCCSQMIGFAVMSFRENRWNGLLSQGLGTSMIQWSNIVRNPWIWLPPTLAGAVMGPLSTLVFKMENIPEGGGMGTSGLVGQFSTISAMGSSPEVLIKIALTHFILPAVLTLLFAIPLRRRGKIKEGDTRLEF